MPSDLTALATEELLAKCEIRSKDIYIWDLPEWAEIRRRLELAEQQPHECAARQALDELMETCVSPAAAGAHPQGERTQRFFAAMDAGQLALATPCPVSATPRSGDPPKGTQA